MTLPTTTESDAIRPEAETPETQVGAVPSAVAQAGNPAQVANSIRDLIVHLTKGNGKQAGALVTEISQTLETMSSAPGQLDGDRLQLTLSAIGEAKLLLAEKDLWGAASAAREAAKEWRTRPVSA